MDDTPPSSTPGRRRSPAVAGAVAAAAVLVVAAVALCVAYQSPGHDWGDDFALYLRQAQALVRGDVAEAIETNRRTIEGSSWHSFSPVAYPWGLPLLLAPLYAWRGLDFAAFKGVMIASHALFLLCYMRVVARRAGGVGAIACGLLLATSLAYVDGTDRVLSDLPSLAFVGASLCWLDVVRERDGLLRGKGLGPLLLLGLLVGCSYSIRREAGIALEAAVLVAQGAELLAARRRSLGAGLPAAAPDWARLLAPHAAFLAPVLLLELVLPSVHLVRDPNLGLTQVAANLAWYPRILAQQVGLVDFGSRDWGSGLGAVAAPLLLGGFVALAVAGIAVRLASRPREDAPLVAYLLVVAGILAVLPYHEHRYLFSVTPLLACFAWQGAVAVGMRLSRAASGPAGVAPGESETPGGMEKLEAPRPALARLLPVLLFLPLVLGNAADTGRLLRDRVHGLRSAAISGPEQPDSREMLAEVRARVAPDETVSFFRARAMNLFAERQSFQLLKTEQILARANWYVMAKRSGYSQKLLTDNEAARAGLVREWENGAWVLWKVPGRRSARPAPVATQAPAATPAPVAAPRTGAGA